MSISTPGQHAITSSAPVPRVSPFRYIIDAMREAFAGHYANTIMLEGVLVAAGLAVVCLVLGSRVFVRENAWQRPTARGGAWERRGRGRGRDNSQHYRVHKL